MSDEYLWNRNGPEDADVRRLERALAPLRHAAPPPLLPARTEPCGRTWRGLPAPLAAAAVIVLLVAGAALIAPPGADGLPVNVLGGAPRIAGRAVEETDRLGVGETLTTGAAGRARIRLGSRGEVDVEPGSELRLLRAASSEHRLGLSRGTLRARIWAPPRWFRVETPSAVAVDLGCTYTLTVGEDGSGFLHVTGGWVAFEADGRESFVPAGAVCRTRPGAGPGTPVSESAPEDLHDALGRLDFESLSSAGRADALATVLNSARPADAFTLWHLLSRTGPGEAARVFDRLAALVPPPEGVTRAGILGGDRRMHDAWWNALGLDDASWWRMWKRPWAAVSR